MLSFFELFNILFYYFILYISICSLDYIFSFFFFHRRKIKRITDLDIGTFFYVSYINDAYGENNSKISRSPTIDEYDLQEYQPKLNELYYVKNNFIDKFNQKNTNCAWIIINAKTKQLAKFIIEKYDNQYFYCTNKTGYIPYPIEIEIFQKIK
jgi:hypothetical protein